MELLSQGFDPNKPHAFFEIPCSECDSLDDLLKVMYEKLYQVTKDIIDPYEQLYQAVTRANDYTDQYLKNPSKEALEHFPMHR